MLTDVIHTVGPQGEKPEKLKECYLNSLNVAKENGVRTIAFPCISTGVYGYPQRPAAEVALKTVKNFLQGNLQEVRSNLYTATLLYFCNFLCNIITYVFFCSDRPCDILPVPENR